MKPPTYKQIQKYKKDGSFQERKDYYLETQNHQPDPSLFQDKKAFFSGAGIDIEDYTEEDWGFGTPTSGAGLLPHKGTNHILVLVFSFGAEEGAGTEGWHTPEQTIPAVERAFNGFGNPKEYPYESVRNYYLRSSYGKCDIQADVYGWIPLPKYPFGWYDLDHDSIPETWQMNYSGASSVFSWFINNSPIVDEIDWNKYDNDHDGIIEGLYLIWNYSDMGWASGWWPQQQPQSMFGSYQLDDVRTGGCIWSWYSRLLHYQYDYDPHTDIHETGHLLGLPDLYDYNSGIGPGGGVGGLDMMDYNWGDHNCFSKFMLNWIKPTVIFPFRNNTAKTIELRPSSLYEDAVIIMPSSTQIDPFNDLFMVEYRKQGVGNDPLNVREGTEDTWDFPNNGLLIWHVDSSLNPLNEWGFSYDNSYTNHKYLKLIEADGLNEIENNLTRADAEDFFQEGNTFDDNTNPDSWLYVPMNGGEHYRPSGVVIDQITASGGDSMSARFNIVRT